MENNLYQILRHLAQPDDVHGRIGSIRSEKIHVDRFIMEKHSPAGLYYL